MSYGTCNCSGAGGGSAAGGGTAEGGGTSGTGGGTSGTGGGTSSTGGGTSGTGGGTSSAGGGTSSTGGGTSSTGGGTSGTGGGTSSTGGGTSSAGGGTSSGGGAGGGGNACAGLLTFAGKVPMTFGSNWSYKGDVGTAAGDLACQDMGGDHVCDYDDIVYAASKGELSTLSTSDTAWLLRAHPVTITSSSPKTIVLMQLATIGTTYKVNAAGSNCANWAYSTDHLNDGEYVDFSSGQNTPTFHLDDNPCSIQALPKDIPCGHNGLPRSVLCCYPKNACNPAVTPSLCTCSASTCQ
jgi:hypothetical protein